MIEQENLKIKADPVADRAYLRTLARNSAIVTFFTILGIAVGYALLN